ncbi:MAG TPA: hypothetical protein DDW42_04115 [Desulfobacteraceae bacterium]|nr:hypothetical protein [Desulfobacteraceae bacterium]
MITKMHSEKDLLIISVTNSFDALSEEDLTLEVKGIKKFIATELPLEKIKEKYGNQYKVVMGDLYQTDDLRVLDYNGHNIFYSFSFKEMGKPIYHEA